MGDGKKATLTLTLNDSRSMREALLGLVEHARYERDYCEQNGRSSRAEAYERIAKEAERVLEDASPARAGRETKP